MEDNKKVSPYQQAADSIIAQLEAGTVPWRKPWVSQGLPKNLISQKEYRGMNVFLLLLQQKASPWWLTVKQANNLGGHIIKGEKGTAICKYSVYDRKSRNEETGEDGTTRAGYWKTYYVFNITQCNSELGEALGLNKPQTPIEDLPAAQAIWDGYPGKPKLVDAGAAYYQPSEDLIGMPVRGAFTEQREYYSTLFHEMVHSTGALKRLSRDGITNGDGFGGDKYSAEELIAEFGASMLCGVVGIAPEVVENSAAYIKHWLEKLKLNDNNKKMLMQSISAAQKACDHIRDVEKKEEATDATPELAAVAA